MSLWSLVNCNRGAFLNPHYDAVPYFDQSLTMHVCEANMHFWQAMFFPNAKWAHTMKRDTDVVHRHTSSVLEANRRLMFQLRRREEELAAVQKERDDLREKSQMLVDQVRSRASAAHSNDAHVVQIRAMSGLVRMADSTAVLEQREKMEALLSETFSRMEIVRGLEGVPEEEDESEGNSDALLAEDGDGDL